MCLLNLIPHARAGQALQPKLTDRLQHHEAGLFFLLSRLQQQILVDEGSHPVQHRWCHIPKCSRDGLGRLERAAINKDGKSSEESLFICI